MNTCFDCRHGVNVVTFNGDHYYFCSKLHLVTYNKELHSSGKEIMNCSIFTSKYQG